MSLTDSERIFILSRAKVLLHYLETGKLPSMDSSAMQQSDKIDRAIIRNHVGWKIGKQPTNVEETERELDMTLHRVSDLLAERDWSVVTMEDMIENIRFETSKERFRKLLLISEEYPDRWYPIGGVNDKGLGTWSTEVHSARQNYNMSITDYYRLRNKPEERKKFVPVPDGTVGCWTKREKDGQILLMFSPGLADIVPAEGV